MTTNVPPRRKEGRAPGMRMGIVKLGLLRRIRCEIMDFSVNGAKLVTDQIDELPEAFEMTVKGTGKKRKLDCVKRWQSGNSMGVEFVYE